MRESIFNSDFAFNNDDFLGVFLGYSYCTEHEMGYQGIARSLGLRDSLKFPGIDSRVNTKSNNIIFEDNLKIKNSYYSILYLHKESSIRDHIKQAQLAEELGYNKELAISIVENNKYLFNKNKPFVMLWDSDKFAIILKGLKNKYREHLKYLAECFLNNQGCIFYNKPNNKNPFSKGSLVLTSVSKVNDDLRKSMLETDLKFKRLKEEEAKIRWKGRIGSGHTSYYALTPKLIEDMNSEFNTKYPIVFWLNPANQKKYNYGWFTVEEIEEWYLGVGPIVKDKNSVKDFVLGNS